MSCLSSLWQKISNILDCVFFLCWYCYGNFDLQSYILNMIFYIPCQVDDGPSVGEGAFVWLATVVPIIADVVNAKFTFETLTATTLNRLYYPAYNIYLQEIDR